MDSHNYIWHYRVHEELGEFLYYFFVNIRPLDPANVMKDLHALIERTDTGEVIAFPIFGRFDMLIRTWLHPNTVREFEAELRRLEHCHGVTRFSVNHIDHLKYEELQGYSSPPDLLLSDLDDTKIRSVEENTDPDYRDKLIRNGLRLLRPPTPDEVIRFYVGIRFDTTSGERGDELDIKTARRLREFVLSRGCFSGVCSYIGSGRDFSIMLKAETKEFFRIADILTWIARTFENTRTETLLVGCPEDATARSFLGDGRIGEATFRHIRGRDLYVQSIIPELYERKDVDPSKLREIQQVYTTSVREASPSSECKRFLQEYGVAYIDGSNARMLSAAFKVFSNLEDFLSTNLNAFIGRVVPSGKRASVYGKAKSPPEEYTLNDLLIMYGECVKMLDRKDLLDLCGDWNELVQVRNKVAHGRYKAVRTWDEAALTITRAFPRIRRLNALIREKTGQSNSDEDFLG